MKSFKINLIIIIFLIISSSIFLYPARRGGRGDTVENPLRFSFHVDYTQMIPFYTPEDNFRYDFNAGIDLGFGLEYRLKKFIGFEGIFYVSPSFSFKQSEYYCTACTYKAATDHVLKMYTFNLYLSHFISVNFYIAPQRLDSIEFFFRLGVNYEGWILSNYWFYDNDIFNMSGNFLDNEPDMINSYGQYISYRDTLLPINVGVHFGFGGNILVKKRISRGKYKTFSYAPEVRVAFYLLPYTYSNRLNHKYTGKDMVMIRNNAESDEIVTDFKLNITFANRFGFVINSDKDKFTKQYTVKLNFNSDYSDILQEDYGKIDNLISKLKKHKISRLVITGLSKHILSKKKEENISLKCARIVQYYLMQERIINKKNSSYKAKDDKKLKSRNRFRSRKRRKSSSNNMRKIEISVYEK